MTSTRWVGAAASVFLAGCALTRATSYLWRPPRGSASTDLIESVIDYRTWGLILTAAAGVVCLGVVTRGGVAAWAYLVGHLVLMGCYSIFALSILIAAINYQSSWTTLGEVVTVATLHTVRLIWGAMHSRPTTERER